MTGSDATPAPVLPIASKPAHLAIHVPEQSPARLHARDAQRNLYTLHTVTANLIGRSAQRRGRADMQLGPKTPPLALNGEAAFVLSAAAQHTPSNAPPDARPSQLKTLAAPPRFLVADGDLAHLRDILGDKASRWLTRGWQQRILCVTPPTDDEAALVALKARGLTAEQMTYRYESLVAARELARAALQHHTSVRVALHIPDPYGVIYAKFPVLTAPGLELAAWARVAEYLGRRPPLSDPSVDRSFFTHVLSTIVRCRTQHAGPINPRDRAHPQLAALTTDASPEVRSLVADVFDHALTDRALVGAAAKSLRVNVHSLQATLIDVRRTTVGRHLHIVRGDDR